MPELPEAETIARALGRAVSGARIKRVAVFTPKLRTSLAPLVQSKIEGRVITGCRRRARYAVADLDDARAIVFHFGMSATVRVDKVCAPRRKHDHVEIEIEGERAIRFNDPRRFGSVEVQSCGNDGWPEGLAAIGIEPLSETFTGQMLFSFSRRRKKPIKELLMDNAIVTGIGNIYAAETLFAAGILPQRRAHELTLKECNLIVRHARRILRQAIQLGGTTVHDFKSVDGSEGKFVQKLKIYGKRVCGQCGGQTAKIVLGGRTSWYCPCCQH